MIPPDSDRYTGTLTCSVTGAGKKLLYIVPLQHEFDLTLLPPDAIEFQSTPKAQSQTCKVSSFGENWGRCKSEQNKSEQFLL